MIFQWIEKSPEMNKTFIQNKYKKAQELRKIMKHSKSGNQRIDNRCSSRALAAFILWSSSREKKKKDLFLYIAQSRYKICKSCIQEKIKKENPNSSTYYGYTWTLMKISNKIERKSNVFQKQMCDICAYELEHLLLDQKIQ